MKNLYSKLIIECELKEIHRPDKNGLDWTGCYKEPVIIKEAFIGLGAAK